LTTRQNYEKFGLAMDINSHQKIKEDVQDAEEAEEEQLFHVPDSDFLNERNPRRPENHMSEEEIKYLRPLLAKYKDDYIAMKRDIKLNNMQWTENKLKKRCARLALLDANIIKSS
jgi:nucleolar protein 16